MFLRTLNVIIISALIAVITPSSSAPTDVIKEVIRKCSERLSSKRFANNYNRAIKGSSLYKSNPELAKLFQLPQKDALIKSNTISANLSHTSKASRLVRDAFLASLISNFFISKNSSLADYCIVSPAAVIQSLICACLAANLLIKNHNKLGILMLMAGQNALQIEMLLFKALFMEPRRIFDYCSWRSALSCFFRTWYPIRALLQLDTTGNIIKKTEKKGPQKSLDDRFKKLLKKAEGNALCFLHASSNQMLSEDYFSTQNTDA